MQPIQCGGQWRADWITVDYQNWWTTRTGGLPELVSEVKYNKAAEKNTNPSKMFGIRIKSQVLVLVLVSNVKQTYASPQVIG